MNSLTYAPMWIIKLKDIGFNKMHWDKMVKIIVCFKLYEISEVYQFI